MRNEISRTEERKKERKKDGRFRDETKEEGNIWRNETPQSRQFMSLEIELKRRKFGSTAIDCFPCLHTHRALLQVLELMREVSSDQGHEEEELEDSSDVSGYHSDSDSAVMASGNSPFFSKSARYNFLSRSGKNAFDFFFLWSSFAAACVLSGDYLLLHHACMCARFLDSFSPCWLFRIPVPTCARRLVLSRSVMSLTLFNPFDSRGARERERRRSNMMGRRCRNYPFTAYPGWSQLWGDVVRPELFNITDILGNR